MHFNLNYRKMKKLSLILVLSLSLWACSSDSELELESDTANLETLVNKDSDISGFGLYKGTFTTLDSRDRGIVTIMINKLGQAKAIVDMEDGISHKLTADRIINTKETIDGLLFANDEFAFTFSVDINGKNPLLSGVIFDDREGDIVVAKETTRGPVVPWTGTYTCTSCVGHPTLDSGAEQTFNATTVSGSGDNNQAIITQIILNGNNFGSTSGNSQSGCVNLGPDRRCNITGSSATIANNRPINWSGTHIFKRGGGVNCSEVRGNWTFESQYGLMEGSFSNNINCRL